MNTITEDLIKSSISGIEWEFQAKFFKSTSDWAHILQMSYESGWVWNFVWFLILQKKQVVTSPLFGYEICLHIETSCFSRKDYMLTSSKWRRFHWRYQTFCRKCYLVELEKVTAISNNLCSFWDILKITKTSCFYMHTDISRTVTNFLGENIFRWGYIIYI